MDPAKTNIKRHSLLNTHSVNVKSAAQWASSTRAATLAHMLLIIILRASATSGAITNIKRVYAMTAHDQCSSLL